MLRKLLKDTAGATAVEYAVIASMVSIAAIGAFLVVGQQSAANLGKVDAAYKASR